MLGFGGMRGCTTGEDESDGQGVHNSEDLPQMDAMGTGGPHLDDASPSPPYGDMSRLDGTRQKMDCSHYDGAGLMRQYEPLLSQNHITAELLPMLSQDDLRRMGIASVGHQIVLLQAFKFLSRYNPISTATISLQLTQSQLSSSPCCPAFQTPTWNANSADRNSIARIVSP